MEKAIFISKSIEGDLTKPIKGEHGEIESYEKGMVLWLNFKCKDGSGAMINLNNLASEQKGYVIKSAMKKAIKEYD